MDLYFMGLWSFFAYVELAAGVDNAKHTPCRLRFAMSKARLAAVAKDLTGARKPISILNNTSNLVYPFQIVS